MLRLLFYHLQPVVLLTILLYTLSSLFPLRFPRFQIGSILLWDLLFYFVHYVPVNTLPFFRSHLYTYQMILMVVFSLLWSRIFLQGSYWIQAEYCLFYLSMVKCFKVIMGPFYSLRDTLDPLLYQGIDVLSFLLLCLLLVLLSRVFRRRPITSLSSGESGKFFAILYCPLSILLILSLSDPGISIPELLRYSLTALFLVLNLPIVYDLLASVIQGYEDRLRLNRALAEAENRLTGYRYSLEMEEKLRRERHELKNHYFYLLTLLKENRTKELSQFLEERLGGDSQEKAPIRTGNALIDYILNRKTGQAQSAGIKTCTDLSVPSHLPVNENALCTILLNLLDNAIEASRRETDPDIQISLKCANQNLVIKISNKTDPVRIADNPALKTTKEDPENHGVGLAIVEETVRKQGGIYHWKMQENYFVSTVLLPLEESERKRA